MSIGTYTGPNAISNAIVFDQVYGKGHNFVIRVYDSGVNVIETHEHAGEFGRTLKT